MAPSRKLHVVLRKEDLDPGRLADKVVIVIDTLFATTTIVAALVHGAREVIPVVGPHEALELAQASKADPRPLLAGELNGEALPGFALPTPQALTSMDIGGRTVVYSTTNGTVALRSAKGAHAVYAACLRNARATVLHGSRHEGRTVLLLCAGSAGAFNVEDFFTAGVLVRHFLSLPDAPLLTDAAQAALHSSHADPVSALLQSRVGRRFAPKWRHEIEYAARTDCEDVVAVLDGTSIVRA